jgi:hypothetical protein
MKSNREPNDPLATWADQTLKRLPNRRAPATLMPRVLAALARQRALPWYQQPWFRWPRHLQALAFVLGAALLASLAWFVIPHGDAVSLTAAKQAATQLELVKPVATTFDILGTLGHAGTRLVKSLSGGALATLLGGAALVWCSTLGLGTAAWRLSHDNH